MSGATGVQNVVYGTKGVSSASTCPGSIFISQTWTDTSGIFWLYGGRVNMQYDGENLWKYNSLTNEWCFVHGQGVSNSVNPIYGTKGTPAPINEPGARKNSATWQAKNNLWLFGGEHFFTGYLNDLWKYNIATNEWTWLHGGGSSTLYSVYGSQGAPSPANTPGARQSAATWTDANGDLWLFGGYGLNSSTGGFLNDLWKYSTSLNQWTWVAGSTATNQLSSYGLLGQGNQTTTPGGRMESITWFSGGELYLFGGRTYSVAYNDFWKYNIASNTWLWIGGTQNVDDNGSFGNKNTGTTTNIPPAMAAAFNWKDKNGDFWLYGGERGYSTQTRFTALWKYETSSSMWIWKDGVNTTGLLPALGTLQMPGSSVHPGSRSAGASWIGKNNDLWLFGGTTEGNMPNIVSSVMMRYAPDLLTVALRETEEVSLNIYPVPSADELYVSVKDNSTADNYQILTPDGTILLRGKFDTSTMKINIADLHAGIYIYELKQNETSLLKRKFITVK